LYHLSIKQGGLLLSGCLTDTCKINRAILTGVYDICSLLGKAAGPGGRSALLWTKDARKKTHLTITDDTGLLLDQCCDKPESPGLVISRTLTSELKSIKTSVGDGTATTAILVKAILDEAVTCIEAGYDHIGVGRGIKRAADIAAEHILSNSVPIGSLTDVFKIASTAAGGDDAIGGVITDAFEQSGENGLITVEETGGNETVLDITRGFVFDHGYCSPDFLSRGETSVALDDPYLLICDFDISDFGELTPLLGSVKKANGSLVILAPNIKGMALEGLLRNKTAGVLNCVAVNSPGTSTRRKDIMRDLAIVTDGCLITEDLGMSLKDIVIEDLGRARRVLVEKDRTIITNPKSDSDDLAELIAEVKNILALSTTDPEITRHKERLANLSGGMVVIRAGGQSESEMRYNKLRLDNSLSAAFSALAHGVSAGCGAAFIEAEKALETLEPDSAAEQTGINCLRKALSAPLSQIAANAGFCGSVVAEKCRQPELPQITGFDVRDGTYCSPIQRGLLDSTQALHTALLSAASIACQLLSIKSIYY